MKSTIALLAAAPLLLSSPLAAQQDPRGPGNDLVEIYERMQREGLSEHDLPRLVEERNAEAALIPDPRDAEKSVDRMMLEALGREMQSEHFRSMRQGRVSPETPAWKLGLVVEPIPPFLREHLGLEKNVGVRIAVIAPNSPAAGAGLRVNDILLSAGGKEISGMEQLRDVVTRASRSGESLKVKWIHRGERQEAEIPPPSPPTAEAKREPRPSPGMDRRLAQMAQQLDAQRQEIAELRRELRKLRAEMQKRSAE